MRFLEGRGFLRSKDEKAVPQRGAAFRARDQQLEFVWMLENVA